MISLFSTLFKILAGRNIRFSCTCGYSLYKNSKNIIHPFNLLVRLFVLFILFSRFDWRFDNLICFCSSINIESLTYLFSRCVCFRFDLKLFSTTLNVFSFLFKKRQNIQSRTLSSFAASLSLSFIHSSPLKCFTRGHIL